VLTSIEKIGQITDLELEDEIDFKKWNVLQQNYIGNRGSKFQISDSSKEILHGLTLKIEQGKELQFTVPMDLEKQPSFVFYLDCCIPPLGLCTSMMIRLEK
jgi:hypothetical protein